MDGTPTALVFELGRDEPEVLHWVGLTGLSEGERLWFDLAAGPVPLADPSADEVIPRQQPGATVVQPVAEVRRGPSPSV